MSTVSPSTPSMPAGGGPAGASLGAPAGGPAGGPAAVLS